jgi:hypothetical protein
VGGTVAAPAWRPDIDSLAFRPAGHGGLCLVHRGAFRTLIGGAPSGEDCLAYFARHAAGFAAAAASKIARRGLAHDANFHLTSRDVLRAETA